MERAIGAHRAGIQMVFQDPFSSFNPKRTVGSQLEEALEIHGTKSARERRRLSHETLQNIGLSDSFADRYPHELSGGQLQRVALGCALITHPDLLIADEPVSALDVSVQAQILELIKRLQRSTIYLSIHFPRFKCHILFM